MYTSDEDRKSLSKTALVYVCFSCFTALFGAVYELFSHEVYSYFMIYAFALPLVLGVLPCLIIMSGMLRMPHEVAYKAWNSGVATLTVGSLYKGVLDIYGTTNRLIYVYPSVGAALIISGIVICIVKKHDRIQTD